MKTNLTKPNLPAGKRLLACGLMAGVVALATVSASAVIVGPYAVDGDTLHLWHLDETALPAVDAAPGGTNLTATGTGTTLGNASFAGFGNALGTGANIDGYLAPRTLANNTTDDTAMTYADPTTGAFTFEAIVRVDFDPATFSRTTPLYLITGENDSTASTRAFQFRIVPNGMTMSGTTTTDYRLHFLNAKDNGSYVAVIPMTGSNALAMGQWYHVAVTYNGNEGTAGNTKLYWTTLDSSREKADELPGQTLVAITDLNATTPDFTIGNVGRNTAANHASWPGLIDEVRLSKVARSPVDMMFRGTVPLPVVFTQPVGTTNAVGQPLRLSVSAGGEGPLSYQWRANSLAISGATADSYSLASPQLSDSADYTVVVTNPHGSVTSDVATVLIRTPVHLTWLGAASADWDTAAINWDSNGDVTADAAYAPGDYVRFDNSGTGVGSINLPDVLTPSSVVVQADADYVFSTAAKGGLAGNCGLTKQGSGTLTLDTDNAYTGPTVIEGGSLTVGNEAGLGSLATRGSLGSGPITNLAELAFNRAAGTLTLSNSIAGNGNFVLKDINGVSVRLMGTNTMSGPIIINKGNLAVGPAGLGNSTSITLFGVGTAGSSLSLAGPLVVGSAVQFTGYSSNPGDNRVNLINEAGTNVWNGTLNLEGNAAVVLAINTGSLEVSGPVSGPYYSDFFTWRGGGVGIQSGLINLPNGNLQKIDGGTYLLRSTGNSFLSTRLTGGTLKLGVNDALPTSTLLDITATLDLAGYNQQVALLFSTNGATPYAVNGSGIIANSSTNADSVFTLNTTSPDNFLAGRIVDSTAGGTRKVGLTLTGGGTLTLTNVNTYSGDTLINAGTLALADAGAIGKSANIVLAAGATLSAALRTEGGMTLNSAQTLKGNGTVLGNVSVDGTLAPGVSVGALTVNGNVSFSGAGRAWMEVNNAAGTSDLLQVNGTLTYGGTLIITNLSASAYSNNQVVKLFNATGGYAGSFANIVFPGVAVYDASNLAVDGTIRVVTLVSMAPVRVTTLVTGGNTLNLGWPPDHTTWRLLGQTNAPGAGLNTNWFYVPGSSSTNQVFLPFDPSAGSVFYRLVYP